MQTDPFDWISNLHATGGNPISCKTTSKQIRLLKLIFSRVLLRKISSYKKIYGIYGNLTKVV